jgi:hypothetical protein
MKLAFLPPVSMLHCTHRTNYQLVLPQMYNSNAEYRGHYQGLANEDPAQYIILDNGAAESEDHFSNQMLLDMATDLGANEIVAPDVLANGTATVARTSKFLKFFAQQREQDTWLHEVGVAIVAQGKGKAEAKETVIQLLQDPNASAITAVHLPRLLLEASGNKFIRIELAQELHDHCNHAIHFLGGSPLWSSELAVAAQNGQIRGMDTSMPFNYALVDQFVSTPMTEVHRSPNYFKIPRSKFVTQKGFRPGVPRQDILESNLSQMLQWANGGE